MQTVNAKLASMRKPQEFVVYPAGTYPGLIVVQSDKSIGAFDRETGKGRLNTKGKYFPHIPLGKPYQFPPEFVKACIEAQPKSGDLIGSSPVTGQVYIA